MKYKVFGTLDNWETVCVTEWEDGKWLCGLNFITSLKDAVETAAKENKGIIFEHMLKNVEGK